MADSVGKYGKMSFAEGLGLGAFFLVQLPFSLIFNLITSPFSQRNKRKNWRRVIGDTAFRLITSVLSIPQIQVFLGNSVAVYTKWSKQHGSPITIEELAEDSRLMWLGPKRTDRVILYFHGGGYIAPIQDFGIDFWHQIQVQARKDGVDIGIAMLNYALVPEAPFPLTLKQAVSALQHILQLGVSPSNIYVIGDSAGGNLVTQLIIHLIHPLEGVPVINLSSPLCGVYVMSPWVSLTGDTGTHAENEKLDILTKDSMAYWGAAVLKDVPESYRMYAEPAKAPESWFQGIDKVVSRLLVSAGENENLCGDVVQFAGLLKKNHSDVELIVQKGGIHIDPYWDVFVKLPALGELGRRILGWIMVGYDEKLEKI